MPLPRLVTTASSLGPGAVATAHPLATAAGLEVLESGGSAVDAAIAAQAVICVAMPQAAGLGGDMLALVHVQGTVHAVNGTGFTAAERASEPAATGGSAVTVPGLVDGWEVMHRRWGRIPLGHLLGRAVDLAADGLPVGAALARAVKGQRNRLVDGGASSWPLLAAAATSTEALWRQPELAGLLNNIGGRGRNAFYAGPAATAIVTAVRSSGGALNEADLQRHRTPCPEPVSVPWAGGTAHVQPPTSQGVLLAMAMQCVDRLVAGGAALSDHLMVEAVEAAFAHRSSSGRGTALLAEQLEVNLSRASNRSGPRSYLHTAGVAAADRDGQVVSSLVSVFDDFGSGVFVPELGLVLNNRAAGFTDGLNAWAPSSRPVHTLAPALLTFPDGTALGVATPGADGQVQTLLQVLAPMAYAGAELTRATSAPRWRSEDGHLLVEEGHPALEELSSLGHRTVVSTPGADVFGAVVAAGTLNGSTYAVADWRRDAAAGGAR